MNAANFLEPYLKSTLHFIPLQDRVVESGTEGRRVQQFIQSLPRTVAHQRNDFSDLGIQAPVQQDNLSDDVSVISATAAVTVHNAQVGG